MSDLNLNLSTMNTGVEDEESRRRAGLDSLADGHHLQTESNYDYNRYSK